MNSSIIGQKFNRLTVIKKTGKKLRNDVLYECLCDCGNSTFQTAHALKNQHVKSCGCLQREIASRMVDKQVVNGTKPEMFKEGKMMKTNTSGYRGVTSYRQTNRTKYIASLQVQGKIYRKKGFETAEDAYDYRLKLEKKYLKPILEEIEKQQNNPS